MIGRVRPRFGRPAGNPFPVLGFLAPPTTHPCTENPRVDGSIDSNRLEPIPMPLCPRQGGHRASMAGTIRLLGIGSVAARLGPALRKSTVPHQRGGVDSRSKNREQCHPRVSGLLHSGAGARAVCCLKSGLNLDWFDGDLNG